MRTLLLLLVIAILNTTCKKEPDPPPHQNTLSAKVNGVTFVATDIEVGVSGSLFTKHVTIIGRTTEASIFYHMDFYDGKKSNFKNDNFGSNPAGYTPKCPDIACPTFSSSSGGIHIDSFKKTTINGEKGEIITGTFLFGNFGIFSITDGKFSLFVP